MAGPRGSNASNTNRARERFSICTKCPLRTVVPPTLVGGRKGRVYLEVFVSYMKDAGSRGFECAYFWAAPPRKNASYILNVRP